MDGKRLTFVAGSLVVVVGAGAVLTRAGSLTPPEGPIQPTMVSLDELKTSLDSLRFAIPWREPAWDYAQGHLELAAWNDPTATLPLVHGSGVVKEIIPTGVGWITLRDGENGPTIMRFYVSNLTTTSSIPLNVRYESGIYFETRPMGPTSVDITVVIRPDPTVDPDPNPAP